MECAYTDGYMLDREMTLLTNQISERRFQMLISIGC